MVPIDPPLASAHGLVWSLAKVLVGFCALDLVVQKQQN